MNLVSLNKEIEIQPIATVNVSTQPPTLVIYLDNGKTNNGHNKIYLEQNITKSFLEHTLKSEKDFDKVLLKYPDTDDYVVALIRAFLKNDQITYYEKQNDAKKINTNKNFRAALSKMQLDLMRRNLNKTE